MKAYQGWMKSYVKSAIENAEIFAVHKDIMSGGDFGGLVDIRARQSKADLSGLTVEELTERAEEKLLEQQSAFKTHSMGLSMSWKAPPLFFFSEYIDKLFMQRSIYSPNRA